MVQHREKEHEVYRPGDCRGLNRKLFQEKHSIINHESVSDNTDGKWCVLIG